MKINEIFRQFVFVREDVSSVYSKAGQKRLVGEYPSTNTDAIKVNEDQHTTVSCVSG